MTSFDPSTGGFKEFNSPITEAKVVDGNLYVKLENGDMYSTDNGKDWHKFTLKVVV